MPGSLPFLSLVHILAALLALGLGFTIFSLAKGDRRHRLFGWAYVGLMLTSLVAILIRGASDPKPFHGYALIVATGLVAAILASRFRTRLSTWRSWHAILMSFSMLAAIVAIGGVLGGVVMGIGKGPAYYRMFNTVIVIFTLTGLWFINTRSVIWTSQLGHGRSVRRWFTAGVVLVSAGLVFAQWKMFQ